MRRPALGRGPQNAVRKWSSPYPLDVQLRDDHDESFQLTPVHAASFHDTPVHAPDSVPFHDVDPCHDSDVQTPPFQLTPSQFATDQPTSFQLTPSHSAPFHDTPVHASPFHGEVVHARGSHGWQRTSISPEISVL